MRLHDESPCKADPFESSRNELLDNVRCARWGERISPRRRHLFNTGSSEQFWLCAELAQLNLTGTDVVAFPGNRAKFLIVQVQERGQRLQVSLPREARSSMVSACSRGPGVLRSDIPGK